MARRTRIHKQSRLFGRMEKDSKSQLPDKTSTTVPKTAHNLAQIVQQYDGLIDIPKLQQAMDSRSQTQLTSFDVLPFEIRDIILYEALLITPRCKASLITHNKTLNIILQAFPLLITQVRHIIATQCREQRRLLTRLTDIEYASREETNATTFIYAVLKYLWLQGRRLGIPRNDLDAGNGDFYRWKNYWSRKGNPFGNPYIQCYGCSVHAKQERSGGKDMDNLEDAFDRAKGWI